MTKQKWHIISRNERAISIENRHFFAFRCNPSMLWVIEEMNQAEVNGARSLGLIDRKLTTRDVTAYFRRHPLKV